MAEKRQKTKAELISEIKSLKSKITLLQRDAKKVRALQAGLKNSMEIYKKLIMASPDAVFALNMDGNIVHASERMAMMLGYPDTDDMAGMPLARIVSSRDKDAEEDLKKMLNSGEYSIELYTYDS